MPSRFFLLCVTKLLLFWLAIPSRAAEFSPGAAEAQALRQNPDLAAARLRIEEARGRLVHSGRRQNPELQIEAGHTTNFKEGSLMVGFVQKFPTTAKLRLEKEVSQALLEAAEAEVMMAERQLVLSIRRLVVETLALESLEVLQEKQLVNAKELAAFATKRAESGEASGLEAAQLELEAQQIELQALQLQTERSDVLGELRQLLGLSPETSLRVNGSLSQLPQTKGTVSPESRPEYEIARQNELAALSAVELEKARRRDDITAGLFAGIERTEDAPDGLQNDGLIGIRLSIPLPFWNKNEGKIQEAAATADRLTEEKEALALRLKTEGAVARFKLSHLTNMVNEIDTNLMPKTKELEEKLKAAYTAGQNPLTDVLRAREKRIQLERARLDALKEFHLIRASLGLGL